MRAPRLLLYGLFVLAVSGYVYRDEVALLAATEDCDQICGPAAECDQTCYNELFVTTCGEYDGGWTNDWCDGNTCEDICGPWVTGEWACWWDGDFVDCEQYGEYAECGDGLCATVDGGETCANCQDDCGVCLDPLPECGNDICEMGESFRGCEDCEDASQGCGDGECGEGEDEGWCPEDCTYSQDACDDEENECPNGWECDDDGFCVIESDPLWIVCQTLDGGCSELHPNLLCDSPSPNDCQPGYKCEDVRMVKKAGNYGITYGYIQGLCVPAWVPPDPFPNPN